MWFFLLVLALGVVGFVWASKDTTDFTDTHEEVDTSHDTTNKTQTL